MEVAREGFSLATGARFRRSSSVLIDTRTASAMTEHTDPTVALAIRVSAPECAWSIFGFRSYLHSPSVVRLPVHLPGEQSVVFNPNKPHDVPAALEKSCSTALTEWFELNKHEADVPLTDSVLARDPTGKKRSCKDLLYPELPQMYVLKTTKNGHVPYIQRKT